ncbi:flagellar motor protein [Paenibacillus sp. CAA11]|uniref:flagellar motor protein MotB n=1 Tax=Paenibacillus sp. CAA11 TaxID=1532905 RepID=UPI000D3B386D|nr:flagellar motor protein MotB [Paenibacillus sp. CAA11]AWB46195.1 flagellar motor protein [Paenibacillus sp. CAA11]
MRQRGRKPKQASGDSKDRWMITYADLITLLLIFFVIMYAMSRLDTEKYKEVTESLQATFNSGDSILDGSKGIQGSMNPSASKATNQQGKKDSSGTNNAQELSERELAFRKQETQLQDLMKVIQQYVKDNKLEDQIFVSDEPKGIAITLSDRFLFDVGKADLKGGSEKTLSKLGSLFAKLDTSISIEGHTDNQPIVNSSRYKDNWELSGARALSVLRYFLSHTSMSADSFQYAGYADTRPAADNSTEQGRQKNRRVEITVLRQLTQ